MCFLHLSGVAVLSCTDYSGSSTASSDITDPGSPFSTASSHSEDSSSHHQSHHHNQPSSKMPPTQTADHPPWPWTSGGGDSPPLKRMTTNTEKEKSVPPIKKLKVDAATPVAVPQQPPATAAQTPAVQSNPSPKPACLKGFSGKSAKKPTSEPSKVQQGKITEYFKSQIKSNGLKKELSNIAIKSGDLRNPNNLDKYYSIIEAKNGKSNNGHNCKVDVRTVTTATTVSKIVKTNARKMSPVTVPRKILPAPAKNANGQQDLKNPRLTSQTIGTATVNLTPIGFPQEQIAYLTPAPKPLFITTATLGKPINHIPIVNHRTTANFIPPTLQKMTINNFNCVKLNATVVPIVKLNALPSRFNGTTANLHHHAATNGVALSVETAVPTIPTVRPKLSVVPTIYTAAAAAATKQFIPPAITIAETAPPSIVRTESSSSVESIKTPDSSSSSSSSSLSSDSGISSGSVCSSSSSSSSNSSSSSTTSSSNSSSHHHNHHHHHYHNHLHHHNNNNLHKDVLEVCVNEEPVPSEPQKSPILSQPKTIRFPAKKDSEDKDQRDTSDSGMCRWSDCQAQFDTSGALLEHLQVKHVISQATQEQYVCLWLGCKVHGRTSCSRSWLERHVLAHAGTKPFRCIVDGCGMRFNSQLALERHVNGHFNTDSSTNSSARKSVESSSIKLFRKNGKKIRYRRQPWSARMFDYFDTGIMEGLQHRLLCMTDKRTQGQMETVPGDTVTLQSQILAKRIETDGKKKMLVRWHPEDVLPDEWICASEHSPTKTVSIQSLKPSAINALKPTLFPYQGSHSSRREKHRRKPVVIKAS